MPQMTMLVDLSAKKAPPRFPHSIRSARALNDPVSDLAKLMDLSDNVFVSTLVVPQPTPGLSDWWYYSPTSGQHIAFYTKDALRLLAVRFGRSLSSVGPYHLFTKEPQNEVLFRLATKFRIAKIVNRIYRQPSLNQDDHKRMIGFRQ